MGLKQYAFDNEYTEELVEDGKYIIKQYLHDNILNIGSNKSSLALLRSRHSSHEVYVFKSLISFLSLNSSTKIVLFKKPGELSP